MLSTLALFIFPVLMAYAASSDLLTMRIANWLVLALAGAYFVLALARADCRSSEIGMSVAAAAIVLAIAFAFFAFGWIGGGDAKLVVGDDAVGRLRPDAALSRSMPRCLAAG